MSDDRREKAVFSVLLPCLQFLTLQLLWRGNILKISVVLNSRLSSFEDTEKSMTVRE